MGSETVTCKELTSSSPVISILGIQCRERWVPRKGVQGETVILCSSTSRAAVCFMKTTGDKSVQREGRLLRAAEIKLSYGNTLSRWSVEQWKLCGRWRDVKAGLLTSGPYNPGCSPFFTCLIIGTHHLPGRLEFRRGNTKNTKRFKLLNLKMCRTK